MNTNNKQQVQSPQSKAGKESNADCTEGRAGSQSSYPPMAYISALTISASPACRDQLKLISVDVPVLGVLSLLIQSSVHCLSMT